MLRRGDDGRGRITYVNEIPRGIRVADRHLRHAHFVGRAPSSFLQKATSKRSREIVRGQARSEQVERTQDRHAQAPGRGRGNGEGRLRELGGTEQ